ncbi:hypothetical protein L1887_51872 [Cichorium endivia]|nr:hypothetical protein L1887_51872 [Cichorium endivia]
MMAACLVTTQVGGMAVGPFIGGLLSKQVRPMDDAHRIWNGFTASGWLMAGIFGGFFALTWFVFVDPVQLVPNSQLELGALGALPRDAAQNGRECQKRADAAEHGARAQRRAKVLGADHVLVQHGQLSRARSVGGQHPRVRPAAIRMERVQCRQRDRARWPGDDAHPLCARVCRAACAGPTDPRCRSTLWPTGAVPAHGQSRESGPFGRGEVGHAALAQLWLVLHQLVPGGAGIQHAHDGHAVAAVQAGAGKVQRLDLDRDPAEQLFGSHLGRAVGIHHLPGGPVQHRVARAGRDADWHVPDRLHVAQDGRAARLR